jgi:uncharacterized membrane protein YbhN (UPF0104 family)
MSPVVEAGEHPRAGHGLKSKPWWPWAKRLMKIAFFAVVAYLLITLARSVEWEEVLATMRRRPLSGLLLAAAPALASLMLYSCFDLLGRHYTGHGLAARRVIAVNFISYAFNLNLGALIGGVAFRYRLYSRLGLDTSTITRVLSLTMLTNWLGYLLLAGLVFWLWPIPLPPDWKLNTRGLQMLGIALLAVPVAYVLSCAISKRRVWTVRGHDVVLPPLRLALLQLVMSTLNWSLMACAIYLLMDQKIAYPTVLGVLLVGAIAGVITHVPAGLGVLEAVFYALLSHQLPESELLAALLMYRVVYYLVPLLAATVLYLLVEARAPAEATAAGK